MLHNILGSGVDAADRNTIQVCVRAILVFMFAVAMVRVAKRRFLSDMTALDIILGIILGSILSRTINGPSPLFPTLFASFLLVMLHRALGRLSYYSKWFSTLVKGNSITLFENGTRVHGVLRQHHTSEEDLLQGLRSEGGISSLEEARTVTLERSGKISVVRKTCTGAVNPPSGGAG